MLTPNETVSVMINGKAHDQWESYDIDSDLMTPADAWQVSIGLKAKQLPDFVQPWAPVEVKVGNDTVLVGRVDEITDSVDKHDHSLTLSGRDFASILVDCAAPIFSTRKSSLPEIAAKVIRPLGLTKIQINAKNSTTREKISVEPGDRAWDVLQHAAESNGLWPWFSPDGTLIIGGPDYSKPPVATIIMRRDGKNNNAISISRSRNVTNHFSSITVLGQTHGTETETGKHAIKAIAKDDGVTFNRPQIVIDHEVDNAGLAQSRAKKLMADSMLSAFDLTIKVSGHRIAANGKLWEPGQRVQVESEPHGIKGIYFLMGRRFTKSRAEGTKTELRLKLDKLWTLDAHPHKRRHRKGKNDIGAGEIVLVN
jgi:prophage tail gpP-like protein